MAAVLEHLHLARAAPPAANASRVLGGREPVLAAPQHEHRHLERRRCARAARRCTRPSARGRCRSGACSSRGPPCRCTKWSITSPIARVSCTSRSSRKPRSAAFTAGRATGFGRRSSAGQLIQRPEIACHHHGALSPSPAGATSTSRSTQRGLLERDGERHRAAQRMPDERRALDLELVEQRGEELVVAADQVVRRSSRADRRSGRTAACRSRSRAGGARAAGTHPAPASAVSP